MSRATPRPSTAPTPERELAGTSIRVVPSLARATDLRTAAAVLAAAALIVTAAGATIADLFAFDRPLSLPNGLAAVLLAGAGCLAGARGRLAADRRLRWSWAALAVVLMCSAVLEAGAVPERAEGAGFAVVVAPLGLAWLGAAAILPQARPARALLGAAAAAWTVGVLLPVLGVGSGLASETLAQLLVGVAATLALLALIVELGRTELQLADRPDPSEPGLAALLRQIVRSADARRILRGGLFAILLFGGLGVLTVVGLGSRPIDLNAELTLPAYFSAGLLAGAAVMAILAGASSEGATVPRLVWVGWALLLSFMAGDELAAVHERLQYRLDLPGQVVLAPLILLAGGLFVAILRGIRTHRRARTLMVAGGALWVLSQMIDLIYSFDERLLPYLIAPEEMLEMGGSLLLGLSLMAVVQARPADLATGEPARPKIAAAHQRGPTGET